MKKILTCFKAYDIRGEVGVDIDEEIAYRVGRAVAQHFETGSIVVGFDARESSPSLADAVVCGICDEGSDAIVIGMAGTEEMYWAVTEFGAYAGIEVTASHNPINYNGMKIVKSSSRPLDDTGDFRVIKALAASANWSASSRVGQVIDKSVDARAKYVAQVLSFVDVNALRPLKVVVNSGNGAAGPTFDVIAARLANLGAPIDFIRVHHNPDHTFPNGIPNPLLTKNHATTGDVVRAHGADLGIAFDGDFDRCFFFDEAGQYVPGEYVVGLLASVFLDKEQGGKIVHDPRVIWNTQDIVGHEGGVAVQSKTGHAFVKQTMRAHQAVYGGEMSGHHYFRDFAYCDSGMIPWLLVAELLSKTNRSLGDRVRARFEKFPSSGERNFTVANADLAIDAVLMEYQDTASFDDLDGVSLAFADWRFNLRKSNTEPLVRLNVETNGDVDGIEARVAMVSEKLLG